MADERVAPKNAPENASDQAGGTSHPRAARANMIGARKRAAGVLATIVSVLTTIVVAVLAVHIVFVAFEANTGNEIVSTVAGWSHDLAWQFRDIFRPQDPKVDVAVNYGLAAAVYLIIGRVLTGLIRRLA